MIPSKMEKFTVSSKLVKDDTEMTLDLCLSGEPEQMRIENKKNDPELTNAMLYKV